MSFLIYEKYEAMISNFHQFVENNKPLTPNSLNPSSSFASCIRPRGLLNLHKAYNSSLRVVALIALVVPSIHSVQAQIVESAKVPEPTSNFVVGGGTSAYSDTMIWSGTGTSIGGLSEVTMSNFRRISATSATSDRLTTFELHGTSNADAAASMALDLGSNVLTSDVSGYAVSETTLKMIDYGALDSLQWYDFKVGLWDGTSPIIFADELTDLNFTIEYGSGSLSYLGSNIFRFTDGSTTSGSDLAITSALAGYFVRSFSVNIEGFEEGTGQDLIAFSASRTLIPVPEASTAAMAVLAGLNFLRRRRPGPH